MIKSLRKNLLVMFIMTTFLMTAFMMTKSYTVHAEVISSPIMEGYAHPNMRDISFTLWGDFMGQPMDSIEIIDSVTSENVVNSWNASTGSVAGYNNSKVNANIKVAYNEGNGLQEGKNYIVKLRSGENYIETKLNVVIEPIIDWIYPDKISIQGQNVIIPLNSKDTPKIISNNIKFSIVDNQNNVIYRESTKTVISNRDYIIFELIDAENLSYSEELYLKPDISNSVIFSREGMNRLYKTSEGILLNSNYDRFYASVNNSANLNYEFEFFGYNLMGKESIVELRNSSTNEVVATMNGIWQNTGNNILDQIEFIIGKDKVPNGNYRITFSEFGGYGTFKCYQGIIIPDKNLENAIREALNKPLGTITAEDMQALTVLNAYQRNINDLTGLEYARNLESLNLWQNNVQNVNALSGLVNLKYLSLEANKVPDISALGNLNKMERLLLTGNGITDISILENFPNLKSLFIQYNQINDISVLSNLSNLEELCIGGNPIGTIEPIRNLTNLKKLWAYKNNITDISLLENLINLSYLNIDNNQINDITALVTNASNGGFVIGSDGSKPYITMINNMLDLSENSKDYNDINTLKNKGINVVYINDKLQVSMGYTIGATGGDVYIPIILNNISVKGIDGAQFTLDYDASKLELIEMTSGNSITVKSDLQISQNQLGTIKVLYANSNSPDNPIKSNGIFATLKFHVKAGSNEGISSISFNTNDRVMFVDTDLRDINFSLSNGGVDIRSILYGDVDGNGYVDVIDCLLIKRFILNNISEFPSPTGMLAADVNGDGFVDVKDSLLVQRYVLGKITEFPR